MNDNAQAMQIVAVLVERLGGSVTVSERELSLALAKRSKQLYVEVHPGHVLIEVIPDARYPHEPAAPHRA